MAGINSYNYYTPTPNMTTGVSNSSGASASSGVSGAPTTSPTATSNIKTVEVITYTSNSPNTVDPSKKKNTTTQATSSINTSNTSAAAPAPSPSVAPTPNPTATPGFWSRVSIYRKQYMNTRGVDETTFSNPHGNVDGYVEQTAFWGVTYGLGRAICDEVQTLIR